MSSNYKYSSQSSPSSKGGADADELFAQADTNRDGVIDRSEFQKLVDNSSSRTDGNYESASYESSKFSSSGDVADTKVAGIGGRSLYELTSGYDASEIRQAASYTADTNPAWSVYGAEVRGAGLYVDPNPLIIRRQLPEDVQTYTQNIIIRYLQPPPLSPPPLIVKDVSSPQSPVAPPLHIRQQKPSVSKPPPLILREKPPLPPVSLREETVVRHRPASRVPPRSVIIERFPAVPAPPRYLIIERWHPYNFSGERKTIAQQTAEAEGYAAPPTVDNQADMRESFVF